MDSTQAERLIASVNLSTSMLAHAIQIGVLLAAAILLLQGFRDGRRG